MASFRNPSAMNDEEVVTYSVKALSTEVFGRNGLNLTNNLKRNESDVDVWTYRRLRGYVIAFDDYRDGRDVCNVNRFPCENHVVENVNHRCQLCSCYYLRNGDVGAILNVGGEVTDYETDRDFCEPCVTWNPPHYKRVGDAYPRAGTYIWEQLLSFTLNKVIT